MWRSHRGALSGGTCCWVIVQTGWPFPNDFVLSCLFFGEGFCRPWRQQEAVGPAPLGEPAAPGRSPCSCGWHLLQAGCGKPDLQQKEGRPGMTPPRTVGGRVGGSEVQGCLGRTMERRGQGTWQGQLFVHPPRTGDRPPNCPLSDGTDCPGPERWADRDGVWKSELQEDGSAGGPAGHPHAGLGTLQTVGRVER